MRYEWDEAKRDANLAKHGLDFVDADLMLESPTARIMDSPRRGEARQQAIAYVFEVLMVLPVASVPGSQRYRVVSSRPAYRKEREAYCAWLENDRDGQ